MKDFIDSKRVEVAFKGTDDMIAEILTMALQGSKFKNLCDRLMVHTKGRVFKKCNGDLRGEEGLASHLRRQRISVAELRQQRRFPLMLGI